MKTRAIIAAAVLLTGLEVRAQCASALAAGGLVYATSGGYCHAAAGSSGECAKSGATGAPTWGTCGPAAGACSAGAAVTAAVDSAGPTCDANVAFDDEANAFTADQNFTTEVAIGSATSPIATLNVAGNVTSGTPTAWGTGHAVFGGATTTSAALTLSYNTSSDHGQLMTLAPNVAWKILDLMGAGWNFINTASATVASIDNNGLAAFAGGIKPSSASTSIVNTFSNTATVDFGSITNTCADSGSITVTGAATGDICAVGAIATVPTGSNFTCRVSATNTAVVRHCCHGTCDPASGSYRVRTFQ